MDASLTTARRRAVTIFRNARDLAQFKGARIDGNIVDKREGAVLDRVEEPPRATPSSTKPPSLPSAITIVNAALHDYMTYIQGLNPGPTKASRLIYIWMFVVTAAYNWVSPTASAHIHGIHDDWDWDKRYILPATLSNNIHLWITYAVSQLMTQFIPYYDAEPLLAMERAQLHISIEQQSARHLTVAYELGHWEEFWTTFRRWFLARQTDGFVAAGTPPSTGELPNGATVLEVSATANPSTFPKPYQWTPLKIGATTQKYLTYNWNTVRSSCLTPADETTIKHAAETHVVTGAARVAEIDEVVQITNMLSDTEKMIAEFWAGGPGTVSPPCIAVVMWNLFIRAYNEAHIVSYDTYFFSGLEMTIHVFEAGRLIWGLKKQFMEARPIQEIRALYRGIHVKNGFGTPVLGESWTPFQESDFVTPPFADFPSGHSGFSQVFANVMTKWFGETIPATPTLYGSGLGFISPVLADITSLTFPTFIMPAGASLIQPGGVVPATDVTLTWTRWQDMADSAGISRKYGGIHAASAHTGSQALGRVLHTTIQQRWGIHK
jgi:hypothetical protein